MSSAREFGVWELTAPEAIESPSLHGALETEVAIVGAGFTGLSTAMHLAEQGIRPVVVEAVAPGFGASGRNAGWMQPDWWLKKPASVVAEFGRERTEQLCRWLASGPALLHAWAEKYRMAIDLDRRGLLHGVHHSKGVAKLESATREWQSLGLNVEIVDACEVSRQVATSQYRAGLVFHDGAVVNPLSLSRELARACVQLGTRIFSKTPVSAIHRRGNVWHLESSTGHLRARRLILATDAYTSGLWPVVTRSMAIWRLAVIGSAPYPALNGLLRVGRPFGELDSASLFSLRADGAGRLVTSTFTPIRSTMSPAEIAAPVTRRFRHVFPICPVPDWQYVHYGNVGLSRDMLPRICSIGDDAWTAYGYSGNGVNTSLLVGGELARLAAGVEAVTAVFPVTDPKPFRFRRLARFGVQYLHGPLVRAFSGRSGTPRPP